MRVRTRFWDNTLQSVSPISKLLLVLDPLGKKWMSKKCHFIRNSRRLGCTKAFQIKSAAAETKVIRTLWGFCSIVCLWSIETGTASVPFCICLQQHRTVSDLQSVKWQSRDVYGEAWSAGKVFLCRCQGWCGYGLVFLIRWSLLTNIRWSVVT